MSDDKILEDWVPGTKNYRIRASVMTGISGLYTLFVLVTVVMFIVVARNKRSGLEKRSAKLVVIQALGCYLTGVDGLVTSALNNWACFVRLWLFNLGFMLSLSAMFARAFHLLVVYKVHELTSALSARDPQQMIEDLSNGVVRLEDPAIPKIVVHSSLIGGTRIDEMAEKHDLRQTHADQTLRSEVNNTHTRIQLLQQLRKYRRLLPYTTDRMLIVFILISTLFTVILSLVINVTNKQFSLRPLETVCSFFWGFLPVTAIIVVYFFLAFPVILWRVWRNRDAYGIRSDLIICDTVGIGILVVTLIWVNALHETQQIWPGLSFIWVYALLIHISSVFVPLLNAIKHNKSAARDAKQQTQYFDLNQDSPAEPAAAQLPVNRRAGFKRMLDSPAEYQQFRTFAVSCFSSELTTFIEEYQVLKAETLAILCPQTQKRPSTSASSTVDGGPRAPRISDSGSRHVTFAQSVNVAPCLLDNATLDTGDHLNPTTSITVSILDTLASADPVYCHDGAEKTMFPPQLLDKLKAIYWDYIDPSSYTSVNATPLVVRHITESMNTNQYTVTMLDELKEEVLFMLYTDVYTRFVRK
ncbi:hypothetical protein LPJ55_001883 [Coemansia sp. RSA 990]|nr:hypothetical protein BX667DRAFT_509271 [Coemansia mojavensis]KAJ1873952.1 hypothetical protein LPJ55_001883 [Coemansia sp. RSA 990]